MISGLAKVPRQINTETTASVERVQKDSTKVLPSMLPSLCECGALCHCEMYRAVAVAIDEGENDQGQVGVLLIGGYGAGGFPTDYACTVDRRLECAISTF